MAWRSVERKVKVGEVSQYDIELPYQTCDITLTVCCLVLSCHGRSVTSVVSPLLSATVTVTLTLTLTLRKHFVRECIEFKLATLTYKLLHNRAPSYLGPLVLVADVPGRRPLRSANTDCLMVPHVRLSSVGNRAFPVAAPRVWNSLPYKVTSPQSLYSFRRHLKTFLFQRSFPDVIVTL